MAQTPWQDLIPYYVARTLPPAQMQAFETQLARDNDLRQEVEDWRRIAAAVWREADATARRLPPLSPEIYQQLQYRNGAKPVSPTGTPMPGARIQHTSRLSNSPLMMIAGFLVVFLCGGIILFSALRQAQQPEVIDTTNIAMNTSEYGVASNGLSETPAPTQCVLLAGTSVPGCITMTVTNPSVVSTWTLIPRGTSTAVIVAPVATATPKRVTAATTATQFGMNLSLQATNEAVAAMFTQTAAAMTSLVGTPTPWPSYLCVVTNPSTEGRPLYNYADYGADIVGYWMGGQQTWVMARTANNWIEIYYGQWLPMDGLTFQGPCDSVPAPSPTAPANDPTAQCTMRNDGPDALPLYSYASVQATLVNYLPVTQTQYVLTRSNDGWYEVFYGGQLAWFQGAGTNITFTGDCVNVPMPSPTYVVEATWTTTPVPLSTTFNKPMSIVTRNQTAFYNGPYENSGLAMMADVGTFWPTNGLTTMPTGEWASLPMGSGQIYWVQLSLVDLIDPSIPTNTPTSGS